MAKKSTANGSRGQRRRGLIIAAAAAAPLIAIPAANATVPPTHDFFPTEPTRVLTLSLLPGGNDDDLSGVMCQAPRSCTNVPYSRASSTAAVATLNAALRDGTAGKQIVFAYSQGARVVARWIMENEGQPGVPTAEDLSIVVMGNPSRRYGGSDRDWDTTFPDSNYHVVDVSQQYDMASDFPDNPFNLLALMNANIAFFTTHQNYEAVDIYDEANYVWTEGNITYVFVPTKNLPLLDPLRWVGLGFIADALNDPLKAIVDRAYDRSYLPAQPGIPATSELAANIGQLPGGTNTATAKAASNPASNAAPVSAAPAVDEHDSVLVDTPAEGDASEDSVTDDDVIDDAADDSVDDAAEDAAVEDAAAEDAAAEDAAAEESESPSDDSSDSGSGHDNDGNDGDAATGTSSAASTSDGSRGSGGSGKPDRQATSGGGGSTGSD